MDLKEFVSATLVSISEGISDADKKIRRSGGVVNPGAYKRGQKGSYFSVPTSTVQFDIALSTESGKSDGSSAKARVFVVEAKLGEEREKREERISRVKFNVDVIFPNPGESQAARLREASNSDGLAED